MTKYVICFSIFQSAPAVLVDHAELMSFFSVGGIYLRFFQHSVTAFGEKNYLKGFANGRFFGTENFVLGEKWLPSPIRIFSGILRHCKFDKSFNNSVPLHD